MAYNRRRSSSHPRSNNRPNSSNYRNQSQDGGDGEERRLPYGGREYNNAVQSKSRALRQAQEASIRGDRVEAERFLQAAEYFGKLTASAPRAQREPSGNQRGYNQASYTQTSQQDLSEEGNNQQNYARGYGKGYQEADAELGSQFDNFSDATPMRLSPRPLSNYDQE